MSLPEKNREKASVKIEINARTEHASPGTQMRERSFRERKRERQRKRERERQRETDKDTDRDRD